MAAKIIKYIPKQTGARTEYLEITSEDHAWLLTEIIKAQCLMDQLDQSRDPDTEWIRDSWWHRRDPRLPRGSEGPNSPASFIAGVIWNHQFKEPPQRDVSRPQVEGLEQITHILAQACPEIRAVRFQIGFQ